MSPNSLQEIQTGSAKNFEESEDLRREGLLTASFDPQFTLHYQKHSRFVVFCSSTIEGEEEYAGE